MRNTPERRRACGNVPPGAAFPTLPALPNLAIGAWTRTRGLATVYHKMYLRHAGRDGCVDIDLSTYSIGPQVAGCRILLQVEVQSHQFAVWHQEKTREAASRSPVWSDRR